MFHFQQLGAVITGISVYNQIPYTILVLLVVWGLIITKKNRWFFLLSLACIVVPILAIAIKQQLLPTRIFYYLVIFFVPSWAFFINSLTNSIKMKQFIPLLALILFSLHSYRAHHQNFLNWSTKPDQLTEELFEQLKQHQAHQIFDFYFYSKPALEYFSYEREFNLAIKMPQKNSIDYADFNDEHWDAVVWSNEYRGDKPDLSNYNKVWEDEIVELYVKPSLNR